MRGRRPLLPPDAPSLPQEGGGGSARMDPCQLALSLCGWVGGGSRPLPLLRGPSAGWALAPCLARALAPCSALCLSVGCVLVSWLVAFLSCIAPPPCMPRATRLASPHAGVIRGGGLTLSCGLEIFIFAYIIHPVQVANFVNAVYPLPMAAGVNKLHLPLVAWPPHPHHHGAGAGSACSGCYRSHGGHRVPLFSCRHRAFIQGLHVVCWDPSGAFLGA